MSTVASEFSLLDPKYQNLIVHTQDSHGIIITPLQLLNGGRSGAILYLVSVSVLGQQGVRHLILKLDRITQWNKGEFSEIARHSRAISQSPKTFVNSHLTQIAFEPIELEDRISFFYSIAGDSLQRFRTLSSYSQQKQIKEIFRTVSKDLLEAWQNEVVFENIHPRLILENWGGYRLGSESGNIKAFLKHTCGVNDAIPGFILGDTTLPNPFSYARDADLWIGVGTFKSLKEIEASEKRYALFRPFKEKNVYSYNARQGAKGGNEFLELGYLRPDIILKDLLKIAHPELLPDYQLYFHEKLE